jgi:hypothetical protein
MESPGPRSPNKSLRVAVWSKYIGYDNAIGYCWCNCGRQIHILTFEAGHVVSWADGGTTTLDNLRPICLTCNRSMGRTNMLKFMLDCGYLLHNPLADTHHITYTPGIKPDIQQRAMLIIKIHKRIAIDTDAHLRTINDKKALAVMFDMFFAYLYDKAPPHFHVMFDDDIKSMYNYLDIRAIFIRYFNNKFKDESLRYRLEYYFEHSGVEAIDPLTIIARRKKMLEDYVVI